jgi:hypothetical protein
MRVVLGGREIGVAEQFLYGAEIGSAVEQVGGERVSKRMRMSGRRRPPIEEASNIARPEPPTFLVQEHRVGGRVGSRNDAAAMIEPLTQRIACWLAQRHHSLFRALPPDHDPPTGDVEILGAQAA